MFKPIFTALAPNAQADDSVASLRLIFWPGSWQSGNAQRRVEEWFEKKFPGSRTVGFASGRGALYATLSAFGVGPGDEVLLQAYTCVAVPGAILWTGAKPVYVDIDPDTLNLSLGDLQKKVTPRSKILIIQHTFGIPADMDGLMSFARDHGLFVIEDCAHALGAKFQGRAVGSFGHASIFSFGRDKIISSVFGGVSVVFDKDASKRIRMHRDSRPLLGKFWVLQQLLHAPIIHAVRATCTGGLGPVILRVVQSLKILSRAVHPLEKLGGKMGFVDRALPNALAELILRQLEKLEDYNLHRIKLANFYRSELKHFKLAHQQCPVNAQAVWLRFTVFLPRAHDALRIAQKSGLFLGDWYASPIAPADVDLDSVVYKSGSCPNAEKRGLQSLNLPTHAMVTMDDAKSMIKWLNAYVVGN